MNSDELEIYLDGRYSELLDYYDRRSIAAKRWHNCCSVYLIVVSVAIAPIQALSLAGDSPNKGKIIVMLLSPTLALIAGLAAHFKFHENWLSYRSTWDAMKRELSLLKAGAGPYRNDQDSNGLFVERIETMVANEAKEFYSRHAARSQKSPTGNSGKGQ